jgi:carboxymethylenebutenolidase
MLIDETYHDVETPTGTMRVFVASPKVPQYPKARFPGVVVFSEICAPRRVGGLAW